MATSVSAIIRTANANKKRKQDLEDDLETYAWQTSEQNEEDWQRYREHLESRASKVTDPARQLTYQNKINAGRRAFTSNQIQRTAIDILEGNARLEDKQGTVLSLYREAVANGDLNLAQNLRQQYDQIDVAIQRRNEVDATRMRGYAEDMIKHKVTTLEDLAKSYLEGDDPGAYEDPDRLPSNKQLENDFRKHGSDDINKQLTIGGQSFNMFDVVHANVTAAISAMQEAAQITTSESKAESLWDKAAKLNNGETKINFGGVSMTLAELNDVRDAARNGQNIYQPAKNAKGDNILVKNKVVDYVWARDVEGNPRIVTVYNQQAKNFGEVKDAQGNVVRKDVKEQLKKAGYEVLSEKDGLLEVRQTTNSLGGSTPIAGSTLGESFMVSLDRNGNVRMISEQLDENDPNSRKIYSIALDDTRDDFGKVKEVDMAGETFFADASIRSAGSQEGRDFINKLISPPERSREIDTILAMPGTDTAALQAAGGIAALQGGMPSSTGVVVQSQNAAVVRKNMERLAAATAAAVGPAVQTNVTNGMALNQMPVPAAARLNVVNSSTPMQALKTVNATPAPGKLNVVNANTPGARVDPLPAQPKMSVGVARPSSNRLKVL